MRRKGLDRMIVSINNSKGSVYTGDELWCGYVCTCVRYCLWCIYE